MKDGLKDKRSKEWRDNSWEIERNRLLKIIGEQQLIINIQKNFRRSLSNEQKRKKVNELVKSGLRPDAAIKAMMLTRLSYYSKPGNKKDGRKHPLAECLVRKPNDLTGYELVYGYRKVTTSHISSRFFSGISVKKYIAMNTAALPMDF